MTTFEWFLSLGCSLDVAIIVLTLVGVLVFWCLTLLCASQMHLISNDFSFCQYDSFHVPPISSFDKKWETLRGPLI